MSGPKPNAIPSLLRWSLVVPVAVITGGLVWLAVQFVVQVSVSFIGGRPAFHLDEWVGTVLGSYMVGWIFVRAASAVSPSRKVGVAFIGMVVMTVLGGGTMLFALSSGEGWGALADLMVLLGACRAYCVVNADAALLQREDGGITSGGRDA